MKEVKDDGGPAFPSLETEERHPPFGMSLRDYFAAAALTGMNASPALLEAVTGPDAGAGRHLERLATSAYRQADAMIKARSEVSS